MVKFLEDIAVFFINFRDLYEGFQERHSVVEQIFRDKGTSFLIVCAPHEPMEVADFFLRELRNRNMHTPVVIANQCHQAKYDDLEPTSLGFISARKRFKAYKNTPHQHYLARMKTAHRRLRSLAKEESRLLSLLQKKLKSDQKMVRIPRFHGEVHDIYALNKVGTALLHQQE